MEDFRSRLKGEQAQELDIRELLRKGLLVKAVKAAKRSGISLEQKEVDFSAGVMLRQNRASEMLAMLPSKDIKLPYDKKTLLEYAFKSKDYHGFLKQAHRLQVKDGMESMIDQAIAVIHSRAPKEAMAWRLKFSR